MTGTQVSDGTSEQDHYLIRGASPGGSGCGCWRVMWPTTRELLGRVGVPEDARCLDVGCGGGDVTMEAPIPFELVRVVLPADPAPLAFVVFAPPHRFADHGALPSPDGETTAALFSLDETAKYFLVLTALCEPRLRDGSSAALPTDPQILDRLRRLPTAGMPPRRPGVLRSPLRPGPVRAPGPAAVPPGTGVTPSRIRG
jgi:hypothetical protein